MLLFFSLCSLLQDDLTGQAILDVAFARLNLIETAYFGLRFLDEENQTVSIIQPIIYELRPGFFVIYFKPFSPEWYIIIGTV